MTMTQRAGQRIISIGGPVYTMPRSAAAAVPSWWVVAGKVCWAAYQPKGAASLAASYTDLTGNGNHATAGVAPTWDAVSGWKFNGSTQYLTTTFVPASDQSQSILIQFTTATNDGILFGNRDGDQRLFLRPNYATGILYRHGAGTQTNAPAITSGNVAIAGNKAYRNGGVEIGSLTAYGAAPTSACHVGAYNNAGATELFCAAYIQALAIYSDTLSAAEVAMLAAAMAAL